MQKEANIAYLALGLVIVLFYLFFYFIRKHYEQTNTDDYNNISRWCDSCQCYHTMESKRKVNPNRN